MKLVLIKPDLKFKPIFRIFRYHSKSIDYLNNKLHISYLLSGMFIIGLLLTSCTKDKAHENDPRLKYCGEWNFKSTSYYFSGYYDYSGQTPVWTYNESTTIGYNDSTGFVKIGDNDNELLVQFCNTCQTRVYNLTENNASDWNITDSSFFHQITSPPPGYTPTYTTYKVEGVKL